MEDGGVAAHADGDSEAVDTAQFRQRRLESRGSRRDAGHATLSDNAALLTHATPTPPK